MGSLLRIRVLCVHAELPGQPLPVRVYHAQAFVEREGDKPTVWSCEHTHQTALLARACGLEWLATPEAKRMEPVA